MTTIKGTIKVDLRNQNVTSLPITNPDELETVILAASEQLTDGNQPVILESLLNSVVDFFVFSLEPSDDIEDIGYLVSDIEDRVCNAVAFRKHLAENGCESEAESIIKDVEDDEEESVDDDENDDPPQPIQYEKYTETVDTPEGKKTLYKLRCRPIQDPEQAPEPIEVKEGMMKRFDSDGFEVTVKLVPKKEF